MTMYGLAIKLWSSEFDRAVDEYKVADSVVYLCHDIKTPDILYLSTVINHLVGDDSLDELFRKLCPAVKGEPVSWNEPLVKLEQPDYCSDTEDTKERFYGHHMEEEKPEVKLNNRKKVTKKKRKSCSDESSDDSDDDGNDSDYKASQSKKKRKEYEKSGMYSKKKFVKKCNKCEEESADMPSFVEHLKGCNPDQFRHIPAKLIPLELRPEGFKQRKYNDKPLLSCSFCTRTFKLEKALEKHELLHQTDPDSKLLRTQEKAALRAAENPRDPDKPRMPKGSYACDKCIAVYKDHEALMRHYEDHKLSESVPSQGNETEKGLSITEVKDGAIMRCTVCDLAFKTVGKFKDHLNKYHHKSIECEDCGKRFTMPNALKRHRLNFHTQFPRNCDDCGHFCRSKDIYIAHAEEVHNEGNGIEMVPCELCGKLLKGKLSLKAHMKHIHGEGLTKFNCDQCGKDFTSKYSLDYHRRAAHTGEYKFRCDECGNGYMTEKKMLMCKNNHAGIFNFRCTLCDYKTNVDKAYKRHLATHSTEKPFICPLCTNHCCAHGGALASHIRKAHKMTLVQAEVLSRRSRLGAVMTEEDIEKAKHKMELAEKSQDTTRHKEDNHGYQHAGPHRNKKNVTVKTQPADEESNEGPPTLYPPPSKILFPYY